MRFLNTQHISAELGDVIDQAAQRLVVVSPYLQFSKHIKERLIAAGKRVPITVYYGKEEQLHTETERFLRGIPGCEVFFVQQLHAKCVLNERAAVISSMNLYTYSQENNWEMGVGFSQEEHPEQFQKLMDYIMKPIHGVAVLKFTGRGGLCGKVVSAVATRKPPEPFPNCACCGLAFQKNGANPICRRCQDKLADGSLPEDLWGSFSKKLMSKDKQLARRFATQLKTAGLKPLCIRCGRVFSPKQPGFMLCTRCFFDGATPPKIPPVGGFCIHCRKPLPLKPEKPMCYDCYRSFASKPARYCHQCGSGAKTQLRNPICIRCDQLAHEADETVLM